MKIGFLGTGNITSAMVHGIAADGHDITVSERNAQTAAALAARFGNVSVAPNSGVVDASDIIIVALMADQAQDILGGLPFRSGQKVFSVMVGMSRATLAASVAPAQASGVMVPFPSIAEGGSPVLACPADPAIEAIFGANNPIFPVATEADLASYFAAQAVLSPALRLVKESADWLADKTGDGQSAETFLRLLVGGTMTAAPAGTPDVLADALLALGTEGGLNAQLRDHLGDQGAYDALRAGLEILQRRLAAG